MNKFLLIWVGVLLGGSIYAQDSVRHERVEWIRVLDKIARPVMYNLANDQLKEKMPKAISPVSDNPKARVSYQYLEAFGRTLSGIAPWLQLEGGSPEEVKLRNQYRAWTLKSLANATDSVKKDYMNWTGGQPLVDASFLALGLIRAPWIWAHLDKKVQDNVVHCFLKTRSIIPAFSNWILFSGMIEAFFCKYGYPYDAVRIEYGVREFMEQWYVGDGLFSDGPNFHLDYYNSYVIQPYLKEIIDVVDTKDSRYKKYELKLRKINDRYAQIQERSINADGSFPAYGRSIVYRSGAFQHLANMALQQQLPDDLSAAQVREALTAVIKNTLTAPGTFDKNGWMQLGLHGHQPGLANGYITQGSLYLCTEVFLPLGLASDTGFWSDAPKPWSGKAIWSGLDYSDDHAMDLK